MKVERKHITTSMMMLANTQGNTYKTAYPCACPIALAIREQTGKLARVTHRERNGRHDVIAIVWDEPDYHGDMESDLTMYRVTKAGEDQMFPIDFLDKFDHEVAGHDPHRTRTLPELEFRLGCIYHGVGKDAPY